MKTKKPVNINNKLDRHGSECEIMQEDQKYLDQAKRSLLDEIIITKSSLDQQNFDLKQHISEIEVGLINEALDKAQGTVATAARILGVRRTTLIEKMRRYNIKKLANYL